MREHIRGLLAFLVCCCAGAPVDSPAGDLPASAVTPAAASAAAEIAAPPAGPVHRERLMLEPPSAASPLDQGELPRRAAALAAVAARLPRFECEIAEEPLNRLLATPIELAQVPFHDVILETPVAGKADIRAEVSIKFVPDPARAVFDLVLVGRMSLVSTGRAHGMRIESQGEARFVGRKRVIVERSGAGTLPAEAAAESSLRVTGVTSRQPRILGRFTEKLAAHQAQLNEEAARQECAAHVAVAIADCLDREVDGLVAALAAALRGADTAAAQADLPRARGELNFRTEPGSIVVRRGAAPGAAEQPPQAERDSNVLLRCTLPAADVDTATLLAALDLLATMAPDSAEETADRAPGSLRSTLRAGLRGARLAPLVNRRGESLSIALGMPPRERLAQEPSAGPAAR